MENASLRPLPGHLYVVATPIGNLADLTERAKALLANVDLVACEDTRTTGTLLTRLGVRRELFAYHEHNERDAAPELARRLAAGASVALVTDAGTPGLSDPGFRVVRACRQAGLPVVPVPGPNAPSAPADCPPTVSSSSVSCPPKAPRGSRALSDTANLSTPSRCSRAATVSARPSTSSSPCSVRSASSRSPRS
jgi:hypothetical protein